MHPIEEAFGQGCNLYQVLKCERDADAAQLRKAYYRTALKVHPDKNPDNPTAAAQTFQALSLAYQILQNADLRAEYDDTGVIPHHDAVADHDKDDDNKDGMDTWKNYFDQIFGKVTVSKIDDFAQKYKCSDEEKRDVLKEFGKRRGNLVQMLEFVMLSDLRDAVRWADDYLRPAMETGQANAQFRDAMEQSLVKIQKKIAKENAKAKPEEEESDTATETDDDKDKESDSEQPHKSQTSSSSKKRRTSKSLSSSTKTKKKASRRNSSSKKENNMDDLIAQIQNKHRGGGANVLANLGSRYGVAMDQQDPLSDAEFAKTRAALDKKRKRR